jgi:thioredoxin-like negative regulator of GroEL
VAGQRTRAREHDQASRGAAERRAPARGDRDAAEPALARRFTVKATPTFILYRNGRQLSRFDGAPAQHNELERWIDRTVGQDVSRT